MDNSIAGNIIHIGGFLGMLKGRPIKYPELQELLHTNRPEYSRRVELINKNKRREQKRIYKLTHKDTMNKTRRQGRVNNKINNIEWLRIYLNVNKISCQRCGYNKSFEAIDGHHLNPQQKKNHKDHFSFWILECTKKFRDKILNNNMMWLCSNCHRELHAGLWEII
jgi:hypothetical protein